MSIVTLGTYRLIGIGLASKTTNAEGQSALDCGNLWQRFGQEDIASQIPDKLDNTVVAVYYNYDGDHTQAFDFFIGCKVKPGTEAPEGLMALDIPEQRYRKLTAKGKMPECIGNAWREIWTWTEKRAYTFDMEMYDERSSDWNNAVVDIFIAV